MLSTNAPSVAVWASRCTGRERDAYRSDSFRWHPLGAPPVSAWRPNGTLLWRVRRAAADWLPISQALYVFFVVVYQIRLWSFSLMYPVVFYLQGLCLRVLQRLSSALAGIHLECAGITILKHNNQYLSDIYMDISGAQNLYHLRRIAHISC